MEHLTINDDALVSASRRLAGQQVGSILDCGCGTAKEQAERLHKEDVWAEIVRRLQGQARTRGDFAGVHVCPETNADLPDTDEARLVILHPKVAHKRGTESAAKDFRSEGY